jgi:hypothetical protein
MDSTMTDRAPARRGRPKGTGINDTELLHRLKAALAADPELRPTTAIRAAGVNDPSAIRRLRDKLTAEPAPTARANKSSSDRPALPLEAGSPAIKTARPRPAAKRRAEAPPRAAGDRVEAQTLASYLAAVGGSPVAAHATPTPPTPTTASDAGGPRPNPPTGGAVAGPDKNASAPAQAPTAHAATSHALPSPFEMMSRMTPPLVATPQTMLEGVRLAVEATAAISRLQVFIMQGSLKGTPLAMMLQGQAAMAQMMLATLAGALARPPTKT